MDKDQTTADHAYQQQVIDSAAAQSFNFLDTASNGFTVANTSGGVEDVKLDISGITQADPCVVTTSSAHGFQTGQLVRFTDLGSFGLATARGMDQLNNNRYEIIVLSTTTFSLKDAITGDVIDSSSYVAYVSGGTVTLSTHVNALHHPNDGSYTANPFEYDAINYKLTAKSSVMGTAGDVFRVVVFKFGKTTDLGTLS